MSNTPVLPPEPASPAAVPPNVEPRGMQLTNTDPLKVRESQTARLLALILVSVLVGAFVIHYVITACLGMRHPEVVQQLTQIFSNAFPVFSGLAGTAVGFYLKERK